MLAQQRRQYIVDLVRHRGGVRVADLVAELGVSAVTIRRDLGRLAHEGSVARVHGGVVTHRGGTSPDRTPPARGLAAESRARLAGALVRPGERVVILAGPSSVAIARSLADVPRLTVMTNSLTVAGALAHRPPAEPSVVLCSGVVTSGGALVGPLVTASLRHLRADWVLLDAEGAEEHTGLTSGQDTWFGTLQDLRRSGGRIVVVTDGRAWGTTSLRALGPLDDVDVLVSDDQLPMAVRARVVARVGRLLLAPSWPEADAPPASRVAPGELERTAPRTQVRGA